MFYRLHWLRFNETQVVLESKFVINKRIAYLNLGVPEVMAAKDFTSITFVNYRLSSEEKKAFTRWMKDPERDVFKLLGMILLTGMKLSLTYSYKDACCISSITCRDESNVNDRLCVSSRHEDPLTALFISLYKHFEIFKDSPWEDVSSADDWG